jgi:hypothetical protein
MGWSPTRGLAVWGPSRADRDDHGGASGCAASPRQRDRRVRRGRASTVRAWPPLTVDGKQMSAAETVHAAGCGGPRPTLHRRPGLTSFLHGSWGVKEGG